MYRFLMHWWSVWSKRARKQEHYDAARDLSAQTSRRLAQGALNKWWWEYEVAVRAPVNKINLTRLFTRWKSVWEGGAFKAARARRDMGLRKAFEAWYHLYTARRGILNSIRARRRQKEIMFGNMEAFMQSAGGGFGFGGGRSFVGGSGTVLDGSLAAWGSNFGGTFAGVPTSTRSVMHSGTALNAFGGAGQAELDASLAELETEQDPSDAKFVFFQPKQRSGFKEEKEKEKDKQGKHERQASTSSSASGSSEQSKASSAQQPASARTNASGKKKKMSSSEIYEAEKAVAVAAVRPSSARDRVKERQEQKDAPATPPLDPFLDSGKFVPSHSDRDWQFEADFERGMGRVQRMETVRTRHKVRDEWAEAEGRLSREEEGGLARPFQERKAGSSSGARDWAAASVVGSSLSDASGASGQSGGSNGSMDEFDEEARRQEKQAWVERQQARGPPNASSASMGRATADANSTTLDSSSVSDLYDSMFDLSVRSASAGLAPKNRIRFLSPAFTSPMRDRSAALGLTVNGSASSPIGEQTLDDIISGGSREAKAVTPKQPRATMHSRVSTARRGRSISRGRSKSKDPTARSARSPRALSAKHRRSASIPRSFDSPLSSRVLARPESGAQVQLFGSPRQMGKALVRQYNTSIPRSASVAPLGRPSKLVHSLLGFDYQAPPHLQLQHPSQLKAPLPIAAQAKSRREQRAKDKEEERTMKQLEAKLELRVEQQREVALREILGPAADSEFASRSASAASVRAIATTSASSSSSSERDEGEKEKVSKTPTAAASRSRSRGRAARPSTAASSQSRSRSRGKSLTRKPSLSSLHPVCVLSTSLPSDTVPLQSLALNEQLRSSHAAIPSSTARAPAPRRSPARAAPLKVSLRFSPSRDALRFKAPLPSFRPTHSRRKPQPARSEARQKEVEAQLDALLASMSPAAPAPPPVVQPAAPAGPPAFPLLVPSFPIFVAPVQQRRAPSAQLTAALPAVALVAPLSTARPLQLDALHVACLARAGAACAGEDSAPCQLALTTHCTHGGQGSCSLAL